MTLVFKPAFRRVEVAGALVVDEDVFGVAMKFGWKWSNFAMLQVVQQGTTLQSPAPRYGKTRSRSSPIRARSATRSTTRAPTTPSRIGLARLGTHGSPDISPLDSGGAAGGTLNWNDQSGTPLQSPIAFTGPWTVDSTGRVTLATDD